MLAAVSFPIYTRALVNAIFGKDTEVARHRRQARRRLAVQLHDPAGADVRRSCCSPRSCRSGGTSTTASSPWRPSGTSPTRSSSAPSSSSPARVAAQQAPGRPGPPRPRSRSTSSRPTSDHRALRYEPSLRHRRRRRMGPAPRRPTSTSCRPRPPSRRARQKEVVVMTWTKRLRLFGGSSAVARSRRRPHPGLQPAPDQGRSASPPPSRPTAYASAPPTAAP